MKSGRISFVILTLVISAGYPLASSQRSSRSQTPRFNGYELVDQRWNIRKPDDCCDHYQLLGTFMVLDPEGSEMHFTYASPGTAEYYGKTGKFADGVVVVKDILFTDYAQLTTGDAHWSSRHKQWFVMIKDDKNAFPITHCGVMCGALFQS